MATVKVDRQIFSSTTLPLDGLIQHLYFNDV